MTILEEMIKQYKPETSEESKAALREILQSIVLVGLSRGGFFNRASFYGGTALRIFYGLNRYSEDLDFTLNKKDENFDFEFYFKSINEVALSYGLKLEFSTKIKKVETPIESAFAKLNTYQTLIKLKVDEKLLKILHKDEVMKVKFEIDCNPSLGFDTEVKWLDLPEFASVSVLDQPSLFAGKIHAILCRSYKNNVKGRDYYDFLFYIRKKIKPNLNYLRNKLIETGKLKEEDNFDNNILKDMLIQKIESVDFNQVKNDAQKFIFKNENLEFNSKELFIEMVKRL